MPDLAAPSDRPRRAVLIEAGSKLRVLDRAALGRCLGAEPAISRLIVDAPTPSVLLDRFERADLLMPAIRLLAHALPPREAVWWAAMCTARTAPRTRPARLLRAAEAAENWVRRPFGEEAVAVLDAARRAGRSDPEAWMALGATWAAPPSDGSPEMPVGSAIETAIVLASVRDHPKRQRDRLVCFRQSGVDISTGGAGRLPPEAREDATPLT